MEGWSASSATPDAFEFVNQCCANNGRKSECKRTAAAWPQGELAASAASLISIRGSPLEIAGELHAVDSARFLAEPQGDSISGAIKRRLVLKLLKSRASPMIDPVSSAGAVN